MNEEHRTEQAQELAHRIRQVIEAFGVASEKANDPILGNEILGALAFVVGSVLANIPDEILGEVHASVGRAVLEAIQTHRKAGAGLKVVCYEEGQLQ